MHKMDAAEVVEIIRRWVSYPVLIAPVGAILWALQGHRVPITPFWTAMLAILGIMMMVGPYIRPRPWWHSEAPRTGAVLLYIVVWTYLPNHMSRDAATMLGIYLIVVAYHSLLWTIWDAVD